MKKHIYKITNLINGQSYIGQSTNYLRRFEEHKRNSKHGKSKLYKALSEYGVDNFSIESLGEYENYCEMEMYYIKLYNTFENGYNSTKGGEEPPRKDFLHYPKETFIMVSDLLYWTTYSKEDIATMCNVKLNYVDDCRVGRNHRVENYSYPLRVESNNVEKELVAQIKKELKQTTTSQKDLAKKYGVSRSCVTMINLGLNHEDKNESYPLRATTKKPSTIPSEELINKVIIDLLGEDLTMTQIKAKHGLSRAMLDNINLGRRDWSKIEGYTYPIRNNKK